MYYSAHIREIAHYYPHWVVLTEKEWFIEGLIGDFS
jgi:hypothetical protein